MREPPPPYVYQAWPAWFYGPNGEAEIFNRPAEVPEGWHDSPAKVGDPKAVTVIPELDEALAGAETADPVEGQHGQEDINAQGEGAQGSNDGGEGADQGGDASGEQQGEEADEEEADALESGSADDSEQPVSLEAMTKAQIVQKLRVLEVAHNPSWGRERLRDLLRDNVEA